MTVYICAACESGELIEGRCTNCGYKPCAEVPDVLVESVLRGIEEKDRERAAEEIDDPDRFKAAVVVAFCLLGWVAVVVTILAWPTIERWMR